MFENRTIAFIGSGAMAGAMMNGLIGKGVVAPTQIIGSDPAQSRLNFLSSEYGIRTTTNNLEAVGQADIVVLAIKPQLVPLVFPELKGKLAADTLVISVMAGITIQTMVEGLGLSEATTASVIRSMPNTPAQIGQGSAVWTASPETSREQLAQGQAILESFGIAVHQHEERYLDMATGLSGSGPGFVFLFIEAMIDAGVNIGFSRAVAKQLAEQTILGSVMYAQQSDKHVAELRNQVTSPGGTTAEGIFQLEKEGLRTAVSQAVRAAYQRSVELGKG